MNLRQPYEQLIADKLRKLPMPDPDASWQQMKHLLDEEEDRIGGGKRPPGNNNNWWRIGIIALLICTTGWLYFQQPNANSSLATTNKAIAPNTNQSATATNAAENRLTSTGNKQTAIIDKKITLSSTTAATDSTSNQTNNAIVAQPAFLANAKDRLAASSATIKKQRSSMAEPRRGAFTSYGAKQPQGRPFLSVYSADQKSVQQQGNTVILNNEATANRPMPTNGYRPAGSRSNNKTRDQYPQDAQRDAGTAFQPIDPSEINAGEFDSPSGSVLKQKRSLVTRKNKLANKHQTAGITKTSVKMDADATQEHLPLFNTVLPAADSLQSNRNTDNLLSNETKKAVAKAQRDDALEEMSRKEKKGLHLNFSNVFKPFTLRLDAEPRWAAGIALNSGITLNAQNRFNYSMNAKSGTLMDYLPSVYLQFHLNDYVYAQTEINFVSPQYTPQLLIYQQSNDLAAQAGMSQQKSIYLQKLYYFSLPLSLHYSPVNNLYFSAGLQFSSFQSGLVSVQEKQYATASGPDHPSSFSNTVIKFRDDSIAAKLSPNEWRWQAGAEYYWNRFTIGLRYNRALKDLSNINLSSSLPATSIRNESLLLTVRYNLFESRKKGNRDQKN